MATSTKTLKNISEIRRFFHRNEEPVYFVSDSWYEQNYAGRHDHQRKHKHD